jgi:hypothetical protein
MTGRGRLVFEFAGTLTKAGKKAVPAPLIKLGPAGEQR